MPFSKGSGYEVQGSRSVFEGVPVIPGTKSSFNENSGTTSEQAPTTSIDQAPEPTTPPSPADQDLLVNP
jgi:hypothetical protein